MEYKKKLTSIRDNLVLANLLISCNEHGIFEAISTERSTSLDELTEELSTTEYKLEPVLRVLVLNGFLEEEKGKYRLDEEIDPQTMQKMIHAFPLFDQFKHYFDKEYTVPFHFNKYITSAASRLATPALEFLTSHYPEIGNNPINVLDIGCGNGDYLIFLANMNPDLLGTGYEIDSAVAKRTQEKIEMLGLSDRINIKSDSIIDKPEKETFDVVLMNHVYHVVGEDISRRLTHAAHRSLKNKGMFANMEIVLDYPSQDIFPHYFDIEMRFYYGENQGKAFRKNEIEKIMALGGFTLERDLPITSFDTSNMVYFIGRKG